MKKIRLSRRPGRLLLAPVMGSLIALAGCSGNTEKQPAKTADVATPTQGVDPNNGNPDIWPQVTSKVQRDDALEARVAELVASMTLEQKIAQMIQPEIRDVTEEDMRKYGFGSYLNGGGAFPNNDKHASAADWIALAETMYQASMDDSLDGIAIPTMWGTDAVHGHNNVIGATIFPHNIGLGAANNPELIRKIAKATAEEVMATGIDWVFAPTVAVVRDDRWGRTYEGYSEDPVITRAYSAAIVEGLQGVAGDTFLDDEHVIATVKHFVGDGGTVDGDDQGNNISSEEELMRIHAQGYISGLEVGAQTVMASFNTWHGKKMHGNHYMLTTVLKERMGFDGLIVGDWNGHGQVAGCSNESCAQAVNAGMDILMAPTPTWKPLYYNTLEQVRSGEISMARIDDAVTRILRVKMRAGLFDKPSPAQRPLAGKTELIGSEAHREIARQAVRESLVLLKNKGVLPLNPNTKIFVTGDAADNIGKQSGGWTITWQGTNNENSDFPGGTSIWDGIKAQVEAAGGQAELGQGANFNTRPDVAIVVFGEEPYAEGNGDLDNLEYQRGDKRDLALLKSLREQGIPVVSLFISGRALWVNPELNASDAFVAAWLPGSEGKAVAEVLFTDANGEIQHDFTGKLSYSWPKSPDQTEVNWGDDEYDPLLPYGFGLSYGDDNVLSDTLSEDNGAGDGKSVAAMPLYATGVKKPWHIALQSAGSTETMVSNVLEVGAIHVRTTDRNVQEDSLQLDFSGTTPARFSIAANFPEDLRSYLDAGAAVYFEMQRLAVPTEPVYLSMHCAGECEGDVDITQHIEKFSSNEWNKIAVDLQCFKQAGTDFSKIYSPFTLKTEGRVSLIVSNISLQPYSRKAADIVCD